MKLIAAKLVAPRKFEFVEEPIPAPGPDEVLIEIVSCGVCMSEAPIYSGEEIGVPGVSFRYKEFPVSLGHEVTGIVAEKGSEVDRFDISDRVTGLVYSGCGFASHIVEKADKLVKAPPNVPLQYALGEPVMSIVNLVRLTEPEFGDHLFMVGDGFMGLLTVAALARYPLESLIVVGHHYDRLKAAEELGATLTVNSHDRDPWEAAMTLTDGRGVDISIEMAGRASTLQLAASVIKAKQRGKLIMGGSYSQETFTIGHYLQNRAPVLVPAYPSHSPDMSADLQRGVRAIETGIFPMEKLVTHSFSLDNLTEAMETAMSKPDGFIKAIVVPNESLLE
ncbi:zinc-binding dehydrogenase [candidate division KSB1 bacterium]